MRVLVRYRSEGARRGFENLSVRLFGRVLTGTLFSDKWFLFEGVDAEKLVSATAESSDIDVVEDTRVFRENILRYGNPAPQNVPTGPSSNGSKKNSKKREA